MFTCCLLANEVIPYSVLFPLFLGPALFRPFGLLPPVFCSFLFGCHGILYRFGFGSKVQGMVECRLQVLAKFPMAGQLMHARIKGAYVASRTHWAGCAFHPVLVKQELHLVKLKAPSIFYKIWFGKYLKVISRISWTSCCRHGTRLTTKIGIKTLSPAACARMCSHWVLPLTSCGEPTVATGNTCL